MVLKKITTQLTSPSVKKDAGLPTAIAVRGAPFPTADLALTVAPPRRSPT
jgi:hypothetical protein